MSDVTRPGREMASRFKALGDMTGMTADRIISQVGLPASRSTILNGSFLLQWQAIGYHIAIRFDEAGQFAGITHESANYEPEPNYALGFAILALLVLIGVAWAAATH
jgi:hypothetical protein